MNKNFLIVIHGLGVNDEQFELQVQEYMKIFNITEPEYVFAPILDQEKIGTLLEVTELYWEALTAQLFSIQNRNIIVIGISHGGRIGTILMSYFIKNKLPNRKILITLASPLKGTMILTYGSKVKLTRKYLISKLGEDLYEELQSDSEMTKYIRKVTKYLASSGVEIFRVGGKNDLIVNPVSTTFYTGENHIIIPYQNHSQLFMHPQTLAYLETISESLS